LEITWEYFSYKPLHYSVSCFYIYSFPVLFYCCACFTNWMIKILVWLYQPDFTLWIWKGKGTIATCIKYNVSLNFQMPRSSCINTGANFLGIGSVCWTLLVSVGHDSCLPTKFFPTYVCLHNFYFFGTPNLGSSCASSVSWQDGWHKLRACWKKSKGSTI